MSAAHPRRRGSPRRWLWPSMPLLALVLLVPTPAWSGGLAVFRIDPLGVEPAIVTRLDALLRIELNRLADAALPTKRAMERLVRRKPSLSKCTGDPSCLAEAGTLLGVKQIISGNVGGLGDSYVVNLKLVSVVDRREVRRVQETISGRPEQLIEAVRVAAYRLVAPERLRGTLEVLANVPGAAILIDGKQLGTTPLPPQRGLRVGRHTLRVTKSGYTDTVQQVVVPFQKTVQVVVKLQTPPNKRGVPRKRERPVPWYTRWWFWTSVAVIAAGAGVALGFALSADKGINCSAEPERCGL